MLKNVDKKKIVKYTSLQYKKMNIVKTETGKVDILHISKRVGDGVNP